MEATALASVEAPRSPKRRVLDLGAGRQRTEPDAVTVDIVASTNPDVVHDLDVYPWPFEDRSFDVVYMHDVIEHLEQPLSALEEIHRITRTGGRLHITTPHFSCANSFTDPTHRTHFGVRSLDYVTGENQWAFYTDKRYVMRQKEIVFHPGLLRPILRRFAARWPDAYEHRLTWIFPAWFLRFDLEVRR